MKFAVLGLIGLLIATPSAYGEMSADEALSKIQSMAPGDDGVETVSQAALVLQNDAPKSVLKTLQAMKSATPIGKNWLSAVACSQYRKSDVAAINDELETFLRDESQDQEARTLVFHWLTDDKPELRIEKLKSMTHDASPELRYAAIEQAFTQLDEANLDAAQLESLLDSARHPDQVRNIIKLLGKVGKTVDQAKHFGFLKEWDLIGPFQFTQDQADQFDAAYPVESDLVSGSFNQDKAYVGKKDAEVKWRHFHTDDDEGKVNLAELYEKEKSAAVYAFTTFEVDREQPALISLTSVNGNKTWLNGKLVMANNVFHVGARLDQYVCPVELKAGKNTIIVKVMQNDQSEQWAQEYQFHCRLADGTFKGLDFTQASGS